MEENLYHKRNKLERNERLEREHNSRVRRNATLYVIIILLLLISIINMASSNFYAISTEGIGILKKHLFYIGIGIIGFGVGIAVPYKFYNKNKINGMIFLGAVSFLILVVVGAKVAPKIVPNIKGAIGWIRIGGMSIQPSECMKLPYIIVLAHLLEKVEKERYNTMKIIMTLLPAEIMFIIPILLQKDLGTAIHYMGIFAFMLFMSRVNFKLIIAVITGGIAASIGFFYYVYNLVDTVGRGYKIKRVESFLNGILKNEYDREFGYQVGQSLIAFGSGGVAGKGYANGVQKYSYLPEIKTDFILACIGEEFGFMGMIILLTLFFILFNVIKNVAVNTRDYFGKYLAIGIAGYIIIQVLINIYVALGMLPVFGIPMPLFSYGGTSIITVLTALGVVVNINKEGYK